MDNEELLKILACPKCHGDLRFESADGAEGFLCPRCQAVYPIRGNIPIMLIDQAIPAAEWPEKENQPCACS